ncbi:MAG: hypothetical protein M3N95_04820 [Actinomycetota bacterium]|nr:hypothetical protein [Actinomycetota bacterium]
MIPRVAHFVFGLRPQDEPFHLLQYLAIESCRRAVAPDEIVLHVDELPYGIYWDLARPLVTVDRIRALTDLPETGAGEYRYAHQSDVIRLDILAADGGLYADIDTLFLAEIPDHLRRAPAVIGAEADVQYPDRPAPEASVSNALIMAEPGSQFVALWREQIIAAMDGTWSGHSCRLATRLAAQLPDEVQVQPRQTFHPFGHTVAGMAALLDEPYVPGSLDMTLSVHMCAHLWWSARRRDFSTFSALDATESYLATADTPLAVLARPYLPEHGLF